MKCTSFIMCMIGSNKPKLNIQHTFAKLKILLPLQITIVCTFERYSLATFLSELIFKLH